MSTEEFKITMEEKKMFDYLNMLRNSGVTNMFGAGSYIVANFGVSKQDGNKILSKWMEHFNKDGYDHLI